MGSRLSPHRLHPRNLLDLHTRDIKHLVDELQLENHYGFLNSQDQGKLPLRHDRDVDDLDNRKMAPGDAQQRACQEPVQERNLKNLDGRLHSLHCGYPSLQHNRNIQPLSIWAPSSQSTAGNCRCMVTGTSTEELLQEVAARLAAPPTHSPSGNPLWGSLDRRNNDRHIALYGLGSPRGRGPKGGDARRSSPQGNFSVGSVTHHRTRLAAPADPVAASEFHQPSHKQGSGSDWLLSSRSHDKRDRNGGSVLVVTIDEMRSPC